MVLLLTILPAILFAQQPAEEDTIMTVKLEEITVTATRGGGEVLQLPMAIGVVSARDFLQSRRLGLNDALWAMPGVLVQSRAGGQDVRLTIRGFGSRGNGDRSNAATVRGVKILVNGIPETEPDGRTALDLIDMTTATQVEVVRSNASTLFGNASGGVVNIETTPVFTQPYLETSNIIGQYGLRKNNLSLGVPFGSGRFFVSATNSEYKGARNNAGSATTQLTAALVTMFDETTRLKLTANGAANRFSIPGPLTQEQFDADESQANAAYAARRERRSNRVGRLGAQFNKEFGERHSLEVIGYVAPKVLQRSERNTYRDFNRLHLGGGAVYNWSGRWGDRSLHATTGVDGASQDGTILFYNLRNGERGDSLRSNKREGSATLGAFLQTEVQLLESLTLTLGGRFDRQVYISEDFAAGAKASDKSDKLTLNHFTPKVALLYRLSPYHSLYVNVGGGLEAPAFNEVDPPPTLSDVSLNPFLKPMTSSTLELGVKGVAQFHQSAMLQSLSYSTAAYVITIKDEIVPYNGGEWFFSAGESRRYGFESGAQLDVRGGFSLKTALTYLDAEYRTYSNELGDFSGKRVPGIAPFVFNARARYLAAAGLAAELGIEHVGSYVADDINDAAVPAYTLLHGSLGYVFQLGEFRVQTHVGVNNMTNEKYTASAFVNPVTRGSDGSPIAPAFLEPGLPLNAYAGIDIRTDL
ncbi:MAG TPA: TonB-dependent receptor [Bacteroidota bacterium]